MTETKKFHSGLAIIFLYQCWIIILLKSNHKTRLRLFLKYRENFDFKIYENFGKKQVLKICNHFDADHSDTGGFVRSPEVTLKFF